MATAPWVILDRDGVINADSDQYIKSVDEWRPIPGSIEAIARLCTSGFKVAIATNQSGIARELFKRDHMEEIHKRLDALVEQRGGFISGIFYCPHGPYDNCECRKPKTGLLDAIEEEFAVDLKDVPFVGDSERDLQCAIAKGCSPILVRTGKGVKTTKLLSENPAYQSIPVYDDLASYVKDLLS